ISRMASSCSHGDYPIIAVPDATDAFGYIRDTSLPARPARRIRSRPHSSAIFALPMPTPYRTLATVRHHGMIAADLQFEVPLDHAQPAGEKLPIFARSLIDADKPDSTSPWLVFLQGGPGFPG